MKILSKYIGNSLHGIKTPRTFDLSFTTKKRKMNAEEKLQKQKDMKLVPLAKLDLLIKKRAKHAGLGNVDVVSEINKMITETLAL